MARAFQDILDEMIASKDANTNLSGLTSTSNAAVWLNEFVVVAQSIANEEILQDVFLSQVEARANEIQAGTLSWYAQESKLFQYGDSLEAANGSVGYSILDESKYIVDLAAAEVNNGTINIIVAKVTSGVAEKLSPTELAAFVDYWIQKRFAGSPVSVVSTDADRLKAYYDIRVNPQIISTTGESTDIVGTFPIEDAINDFLQSFQSGNFSNAMQVMDLTSIIEGVTGVENVVATDIQAAPSIGSFSDILATADQTYNSIAGYMIIEPTTPLSATLNYSV